MTILASLSYTVTEHPDGSIEFVNEQGGTRFASIAAAAEAISSDQEVMMATFLHGVFIGRWLTHKQLQIPFDYTTISYDDALVAPMVLS